MGPLDPLLPPGPADDRLVQTVRLHRDPVGTVTAARDRFGDVFTLRHMTGPIVAVTAPAELGPLMEADPATAHAGEARRRLVGMSSTRSVLGGDGAAHREARAAVAAAFAPERLGGRRETMASIARAHAERWPRGRPLRLLARLRTVVDELFVREVLGVRDAARARALAGAMQRMLRWPGNPPLSPPRPDDGRAGAVAQALFLRRRAPVLELLRREVAARRAGAASGDGALALLLEPDPSRPVDDLLDELLPLLLAAQEPAAAALTWLVDRLGRDPGLAERHLAGGAARDAVVRDTLRRRPAVFAVMRRLTAPRDVAGHRLPAGTTTMLPIPLLHRDPALYLPFGGGARRCLGEALAHVYLESVAPAILTTVRLRPLWPRPERVVLRGTILVPHRSAPYVVER